MNEVMDENQKMLRDGEAVKERRREYFKTYIMNVENGGPAVITAVVLNGGGGV